jgi:hypothetical protein
MASTTLERVDQRPSACASVSIQRRTGGPVGPLAWDPRFAFCFFHRRHIPRLRPIRNPARKDVVDAGHASRRAEQKRDNRSRGAREQASMGSESSAREHQSSPFVMGGREAADSPSTPCRSLSASDPPRIAHRAGSICLAAVFDLTARRPIGRHKDRYSIFRQQTRCSSAVVCLQRADARAATPRMPARSSPAAKPARRCR